MIDESYVREFKSLAPLKNSYGQPNNIYGFQYWIYTGMPYEVTYYRGILGQYIISIPEFDLVIIRTGNGETNKWLNTPTKSDDDLVGHKTGLPAYISTAMGILGQVR